MDKKTSVGQWLTPVVRPFAGRSQKSEMGNRISLFLHDSSSGYSQGHTATRYANRVRVIWREIVGEGLGSVQTASPINALRHGRSTPTEYSASALVK